MIEVFVTSDLNPETAAHSRKRIQEEMEAPVGDALVTEESTGIRKLRALASSKTDISDVTVSFGSGTVTFTFRVTLTTMTTMAL